MFSVFCRSGVGLKTDVPPACEKGSFSQSKLRGRENVCVLCAQSSHWTVNSKSLEEKGRIIQSRQFGAVASEQLACIHYVQNLKLKIGAFSFLRQLCGERPRIILDEEKNCRWWEGLLLSDRMRNQGWSEFYWGGVCFPVQYCFSCMTRNQYNETRGAVMADTALISRWQHRLGRFWSCKWGRIWCQAMQNTMSSLNYYNRFGVRVWSGVTVISIANISFYKFHFIEEATLKLTNKWAVSSWNYLCFLLPAPLPVLPSPAAINERYFTTAAFLSWLPSHLLPSPLPKTPAHQPAGGGEARLSLAYLP